MGFIRMVFGFLVPVLLLVACSRTPSDEELFERAKVAQSQGEIQASVLDLSFF